MLHLKQNIALLLFVWITCFATAIPAFENTSAVSSEDLTILFKEGVLEINNIPVSLPTKLENITSLFGTQPRFSEKASDIYTWDDLGIKFWSRYQKKTIFQLSVYIRKKPKADYLNYVEGYIDSRPKQNFRGTLIIDGVRITQELTFEELNARKTGTAFRRTHWAHKYKFSGKVKNEPDKSYTIIVYLYDDRTIRKFEIDYEQRW